MNPAALFAAHKTAVLGTAAAAVAGLALLRKKKGTGSATAGATTPGTATTVPADGFMGPDSSAYDVYNALMPELDALRQTIGQPVGPVPAPNPTSPILKPTPPIHGDNNVKPITKKTFRPAPKTAPAPAPAPKHMVDTWVTVRPGDSLSEIAARFKPTDITWQTLAQQNKIQNPNVIKPGQKIHVVG